MERTEKPGRREEAVQEGYLRAFGAIGRFTGASSLSTWLTRIVLNEALGRRRAAQRKRRLLREQSIALIDDYRENLMGGSATSSSPEAHAARGQVAKLLEQSIADLPEPFRIVFMVARRRWAERRGNRGLFRLPQGGYRRRPTVYCFFCATFLLLVLCTAFFVVLCVLLEATFFLLVVFFFATVAVLPRSLSACACVNSPASTSAATQTCESFLILRDMQARSPSVPSPYSPQYLW